MGSHKGIWLSDIKDGEEMIEPLIGSSLRQIYDWVTLKTRRQGEVIVPDDTMIGEDEVKKILSRGIDRAYVRSVLHCNTRHGVCSKCYGADLAFGTPINVGEAVGIIAALADRRFAYSSR